MSTIKLKRYYSDEDAGQHQEDELRGARRLNEADSRRACRGQRCEAALPGHGAWWRSYNKQTPS